MFPVWISPTQVRIIPVSKEYLEFAKDVAKTIEKFNIRVDVDDRDQTVGNRIREAEVEWTPYIIVLGEKELKKDEISVRIRKGRKEKSMKVEDLIELVQAEISDKPVLPLNMPSLISKRPIFI